MPIDDLDNLREELDDGFQKVKELIATKIGAQVVRNFPQDTPAFNASLGKSARRTIRDVMEDVAATYKPYFTRGEKLAFAYLNTDITRTDDDGLREYTDNIVEALPDLVDLSDSSPFLQINVVKSTLFKKVSEDKILPTQTLVGLFKQELEARRGDDPDHRDEAMDAYNVALLARKRKVKKDFEPRWAAAGVAGPIPPKSDQSAPATAVEDGAAPDADAVDFQIDTFGSAASPRTSHRTSSRSSGMSGPTKAALAVTGLALALGGAYLRSQNTGQGSSNAPAAPAVARNDRPVRPPRVKADPRADAPPAAAPDDDDPPEAEMPKAAEAPKAADMPKAEPPKAAPPMPKPEDEAKRKAEAERAVALETRANRLEELMNMSVEDKAAYVRKAYVTPLQADCPDLHDLTQDVKSEQGARATTRISFIVSEGAVEEDDAAKKTKSVHDKMRVAQGAWLIDSPFEQHLYVDNMGKSLTFRQSAKTGRFELIDQDGRPMVYADTGAPVVFTPAKALSVGTRHDPKLKDFGFPLDEANRKVEEEYHRGTIAFKEFWPGENTRFVGSSIDIAQMEPYHIPDKSAVSVEMDPNVLNMAKWHMSGHNRLKTTPSQMVPGVTVTKRKLAHGPKDDLEMPLNNGLGAFVYMGSYSGERRRRPPGGSVRNLSETPAAGVYGLLTLLFEKDKSDSTVEVHVEDGFKPDSVGQNRSGAVEVTNVLFRNSADANYKVAEDSMLYLWEHPDRLTFNPAMVNRSITEVSAKVSNYCFVQPDQEHLDYTLGPCIPQPSRQGRPDARGPGRFPTGFIPGTPEMPLEEMLRDGKKVIQIGHGGSVRGKDPYRNPVDFVEAMGVLAGGANPENYEHTPVVPFSVTGNWGVFNGVNHGLVRSHDTMVKEARGKSGRPGAQRRGRN